jgi:hypothetical protein
MMSFIEKYNQRYNDVKSIAHDEYTSTKAYDALRTMVSLRCSFDYEKQIKDNNLTIKEDELLTIYTKIVESLPLEKINSLFSGVVKLYRDIYYSQKVLIYPEILVTIINKFDPNDISSGGGGKNTVDQKSPSDPSYLIMYCKFTMLNSSQTKFILEKIQSFPSNYLLNFIQKCIETYVITNLIINKIVNHICKFKNIKIPFDPKNCNCEKVAEYQFKKNKYHYLKVGEVPCNCIMYHVFGTINSSYEPKININFDIVNLPDDNQWFDYINIDKINLPDNNHWFEDHLKLIANHNNGYYGNDLVCHRVYDLSSKIKYKWTSKKWQTLLKNTNGKSYCKSKRNVINSILKQYYPNETVPKTQKQLETEKKRREKTEKKNKDKEEIAAKKRTEDIAKETAEQRTKREKREESARKRALTHEKKKIEQEAAKKTKRVEQEQKNKEYLNLLPTINKEFAILCIKNNDHIDYRYLKIYNIEIDDDIISACIAMKSIIPVQYIENYSNTKKLTFKNGRVVGQYQVNVQLQEIEDELKTMKTDEEKTKYQNKLAIMKECSKVAPRPSNIHDIISTMTEEDFKKIDPIQIVLNNVDGRGLTPRKSSFINYLTKNGCEITPDQAIEFIKLYDYKAMSEIMESVLKGYEKKPIQNDPEPESESEEADIII